ncbi:NusG domain II-containing protein [Clostridium sp. SHJSY1]|uniref:NusG domain II-containing protein n=1 Tax=Clostridium sp. SHJSY1 TaxID=2942483 RepID=UPI002876142C|nr:NusG domain II-containing protein [Clostridium sp. SHJSY1]MDS0524431.1 NusG domain II-containing protein [Clostridium sp. SHJSY1]
MFKKWDIILIVFLITLSFIPELVFGIILGKSYNRTYAEITLNGKFYKKIPLSEHTGEEQIDIKTDYGYNILKIKDKSIQILDADCPDKICVKSGFISNPGEQLVCLPHKLMIQIKSNNNNKNNVDVITTH